MVLKICFKTSAAKIVVVCRVRKDSCTAEMGPIRVALIGLSSGSTTSWAAQGHLPYLLSSRGKSHYEIVALLNTSANSAEAAKKYFSLSPSVKAYGSPGDLAADPDIDLVVCITRVDKHYSTVKPSIEAGKAVYVEWPITENYQRALDLTGGNRLDNSIGGLQGRFSPVAIKVKEILASGRIGRVLSSDIRAFAALFRRDALPESLAYFADRKIGDSPLTIKYVHTIDIVHDVLGEFDSFESRMQIQRPTIALVDNDGKQTGTVTSDVPDFVAVHGSLEKSEKDRVVDGATLAVTFRAGEPFKGKPAFTWTINGERGEILVTSVKGPYLHSDSYVDPITIEVHDHSTDEVIDIEWDWEDWQKDLPVRSRIVAQIYERYARWVEKGRPISVSEEDQWPRLHDAVARHKDLETLFQQYDGH